jgi:hypothetical protein
VLNPFFQQGSKSEQNLVQDLINEQLRMYGVEVHYLPRKYMNEKTVIREVVQSVFDDSYPLEAYVDNFDGYAENPTLLSKFGIEQTNEVTLVISRERWETYIQPLLKNESNVKLTTRPKEGDLVYFPLGDRLFEIKYVEHEKPFYQLKKNYVYTLKCELFRYEDEVIDTGVSEIDDTLIGDNADGTSEDGLSTLLGSSQTLTLVGSGVTASAVLGFNTEGSIRLITLSNRGGGYSAIPTIGVSSAPAGGVTGILTATMISGINVCNLNISSNLKSVQSVVITNPGAGYTLAPTLQITGGGGSGAAGTVFIGDGTVGIVTLSDAGSGYTTAPTVTITAPVGAANTRATAEAVVSSAGTITSINIVNAGAGYTSSPTITIGDPSLDNSGNFKFNEIVTGSITGVKGRVRTWSATTNILEVANVSGMFSIGEDITGNSSGAVHALRVVSEDPPEDGFADNVNIESAADDILDFSEQNPFGIP